MTARATSLKRFAMSIVPRDARASATARFARLATAFVGVAAMTVRGDADPTSGVDSVLARPAYDANGLFAVEGARLLSRHDLSFKLALGYARSPLSVAVPGIGGGDGNRDPDRVLTDVTTIDMVFAMSITDRLEIGLAAGAYRTRTGPGYGVRGRYLGPGGAMSTPSSGLIALRPLSNIDPSADPNDRSAYLGDGLAGPLDARAALKLSLVRRRDLAVTAIGSVFLPFGDDEMLLGDRGLVFEPKLAFEWRSQDGLRVVANTALRIRQRTVLESYDVAASGASTADARAFLDVGSEAIVGIGAAYPIAPRLQVLGEAQLFVPLPAALSYGNCRRFDGARCSTMASTDYFGSAGEGDLTALIAAGAQLRMSADVATSVMVATGPLGARGEDVRVAVGVTWAPQPVGAATPGRNDRDGDGVTDSIDGCRDEPEDRDGYQDEDGCPDLDNDGDGIADAQDRCPNDPEDKDGFEDGDGCPEPDNDGDGIFDSADRCPNQPEDRDGFEDEDGCPDDDNDGDGFPDARDRCPNDPETVNGIDDDDGCPDVRTTAGPEERADRIDLKGVPVVFTRANTLPLATQRVLDQVASLIKARRLTIRVEVHAALGTRATAAAAVAAQRRRDKQLTQQRAKVVLDYLLAQGVPLAQIQAVGLGSDRPLAANPTDASNERVDFIKAQQ